MVKIARLVGGAGTGKTSELLKIMEGAKKDLGGSPFALGFTSFTRAARAEAVSRASAAWKVPASILESDGWFRTVHSICHRQLGITGAQMLDEHKESSEWIADAIGVHLHCILDEDTGGYRYTADSADRSAAQALTCWSVARARLEPLEATIKRIARCGQAVPSFSACKRYIEKYEDQKHLHDRVDFADLLQRFGGVRMTVDGPVFCDPEGELPPSVKAWVMDEQQDASAAVDLVCRRLAGGPAVKWVYTSGDPMQSIFGFGGSDSKFFMGWKVDKERVMEKTWRCPAPVLTLGEASLKRMKEGYWDRGIAPADHEGSVERGGYMEQALRGIDPTKDTLVLARCKYIVEKYEKTLVAAGIPFLQLKAKGETIPLRAAKALWDLEHGKPVTGDDFACVMKTIHATGNLVRGAKAMWERETTIQHFSVVPPARLEEAGFKESMIEKVRSGAWGEMHSGFRRWHRAAKKHGPELASQPVVRTGTIHSAKGMEADVVVLSTTVSKNIYESQAIDREKHDEERRVEYVGITRARRRLILTTEDGADYRMRIQA